MYSVIFQEQKLYNKKLFGTFRDFIGDPKSKISSQLDRNFQKKKNQGYIFAMSCFTCILQGLNKIFYKQGKLPNDQSITCIVQSLMLDILNKEPRKRDKTTQGDKNIFQKYSYHFQKRINIYRTQGKKVCFQKFYDNIQQKDLKTSLFKCLKYMYL